MAVIKKLPFPYRLPFKRLDRVYGSIEEAFAVHDYPYVARFAHNNPELRGCALILLGNRVGGERIFEQNKINTGQSCFYRAYAAWQDGDNQTARQWLAESRALDKSDIRVDRLAALINRDLFRIVIHMNPYDESRADGFSDLPGLDVQLTHHLSKKGQNVLAFDKPLPSLLPAGAPVDLVLLDGFKLPPIGLGDCGAPVVAHMFDHEIFYELLDATMAEIDLLTIGSTTEIVELSRGFGCPATSNLLPVHVQIPHYDISLNEKYADMSKREIDLIYSSHLGNDSYRYKRQEALPLAKLDDKFSIKILSQWVPLNDYWELMRSARFTIMPTRSCNFVSMRAVESIVSGTLHLVEEENSFPYIFSEHFHCFPVYSHETILADVERHLKNYDRIFKSFEPQIPQLEKEIKSLVPASKKHHMARYLRHLLFMTRVETNIGETHRARPKSTRTQVRTNTYEWKALFPAELEQYIQQLSPPGWLRLALAQGMFALTKGLSKELSLTTMIDTIGEGLKHLPDSSPLYFIRGLCRRFLENPEGAEEDFTKVTSGQLVVRPDDPGAFWLGRFNSFYWLADARIRARCPQDLEQYVAVEDVVKSYAWANRADIALHQGFAHAAAKRKTHAVETFMRAVDFATQSMDLMMANDAAHRVYLRALLALSEFDSTYCSEFVEAFGAACYHDYTVMHDFAAAAIDCLLSMNRVAEAEKVRSALDQFIRRVSLADREYNLYPEIIPLLYRHGVSHKKHSWITR